MSLILLSSSFRPLTQGGPLVYRLATNYFDGHYYDYSHS